MRSLLLLIPVFVFGAPLQRPEQPAAPPPQISLNVVVVDSKGRSATDLTAADLEIQDNGKPQKIAGFRRQDARLPDAAPLGPRQYSNRSVTSLPHASVILFDLLNMRFEDRGYVFNQLTRSLQQVESPASLYLYLLTANNQLYPVHALPGNEGEPGGNDAAWTSQIQSLLGDAMRNTMATRPVELDIDTRVRETFASLSVLASRLAGLPGRKNIVWITHGVPISLSPNRTYTGDTVDYAPYVRQLSHTLDRADTSIYAVQQSPPGSAVAQSADAGRGGFNDSAENTPGRGMGSEATLTEFADMTGGRAWENNDISGAIKQAINDSRQSYLVSYVPPMENWDGKYHKIRIASRRKGLHLQTRRGYYAFTDQAASGKQMQDAIQSAITSPFDAAEIGLRATSAPLQQGTASGLRLTVHIDLNDVQLTPASGSYTGRLAMRFLEYQDNGSIKQLAPSTLELKLSPAERTAGMKDGYRLVQDIAVAPNVKKFRVIVYDEASDAIGSLSIPGEK
jgi:VWFA-related protein